ncbi:MAG: 50S ribosomal protein L9 [Proteobacteria bacterium]|nr:50S ribosomal protein L9 [Pseudomonadota bacterium]
MEVILLERIDRLGQMGEVVNVKPGFARNFLFPQKKALRANKENRAYYESKKVELEAVNLKRKGEAEVVAKKMDGMKLIIVRSAGEGGQLYGSVSARDIAAALKEQGVTVEATQVLLNAPVKVLGTFKTPVRLHPEVKVDVEFTIARSMEEGNLKIAEAAQLLERAEDAEKLIGDEAPAEDGAEEAQA